MISSSNSQNSLIDEELILPDELEHHQRCGDCPGCLRKPCNECSKCKNGEKSRCIDTYCMNTDEGRKQREAAKAKYLESLTKAKLSSGTFKKDSLDFTPNK